MNIYFVFQSFFVIICLIYNVIQQILFCQNVYFVGLLAFNFNLYQYSVCLLQQTSKEQKNKVIIKNTISNIKKN